MRAGKTNKSLFYLLLAAVFLCGMLGRLLLSPRAEETSTYSLLLEAPAVDNLLLYSLFAEGDTVFVLESEGRVSKISAVPKRLTARKEGVTRKSISRLQSTVSFSVTVEGFEKDGGLRIGNTPLPLGEGVTVLGKNCVIHATLLRFTPLF